MIKLLLSVCLHIALLILGIYAIKDGHPIWGWFLIILSIPHIKFKHIDDGKHELHIVIKGQENE